MDKTTGNTRKIAICEDERIVALDLRSFLLRNNYQVGAVVPSAEDLLESIETDKPDLVLMDINLQGRLDGIEASSVLHQKWGIPVIFLTAYADSHTIERAKFSHPYAYIIKPYDERELKIAISIGLYRAAMEKKLRQSEERYKLLFHSAMTATMLVESDGSILEHNEAFEKLAPGVKTIWPLLNNEGNRNEFLEAVKNHVFFGPAEASFSYTGSEIVWVILSATPIVLPDGREAYQCQAIDITKRKQLEEELLQNQKLTALGRLSGGVAHDFNNVLTAILGYTRLIRFDLDTL